MSCWACSSQRISALRGLGFGRHQALRRGDPDLRGGRFAEGFLRRADRKQRAVAGLGVSAPASFSCPRHGKSSRASGAQSGRMACR